MKNRTAVLIPARNEAPRINTVLMRVRRVLPDAPILVVDDASSDATCSVAGSFGATVLRRVGPGYARALALGYRQLAALGADRVVQLDADGQHPPEAIPSLLEALDDANWVVGSRRGGASPMAFDRRAGNALLGLAVRLASGVTVTDPTSGFWAVDSMAIAAFGSFFPDDVADANIRVLAARRGLIMREVPVLMAEREGGESMHAGLRGYRNMQRSLRAIWRESRQPRSP